MSLTDRRTLLQLLGGSALAASLPASIARALEIPANNTTGTIKDVEHVVIMMQENRSFDHYFGTLNGVRGFGDPRPVTLTTGNPVFYQPSGDSYILPFHPTATDLGLQFTQDLPHDWTTTHEMWNNGQWDSWIAAKGPVSMAYMTRGDVPFHYALADAFTICDAYHCSVLGPTDPNRIYLWTGWVGNDGNDGGPAVDNSGEDYSWRTFPENLQAAGITWKIYQDIGKGLDAANIFGWDISDPLAGNFADNPMAYFAQYQNAAPGSPLAVNAMSGTEVAVSGGLFDQLIADVTANTLPQVSWVVAPEGLSEHPNWPANYGAWYVSQVLDALTSNPEVWSKTVLFICYDENDGFFDHMVAPTPPADASQGYSTISTALEIYPGGTVGTNTYASGPYGLGVRVPMLVVSPWSRGGYVNSQLFDHTSVIRFIERRFGPGNGTLFEHNISHWRRGVCGDLATAFNFKTPNATVVTLPDTSAYQPPSSSREPSYVPTPPSTQTMPAQELGTRPARALPYRFNVNGLARFGVGELHIDFENTGNVGAVFQVRDNSGANGPWSYTVGKHNGTSGLWPVTSLGTNLYDFSVFGPNGYLRQFKGGLQRGVSGNLEVASSYDADGTGISVLMTSDSHVNMNVTATNLYNGDSLTQLLTPGQSVTKDFDLTSLGGWYDIVVTVDVDSNFGWRLAGHVENGQDSITDPGIGSTL